MATLAEREQLLAVTCPWCSAGVNQDCFTGTPDKPRRITSLDGGAHDLRWRRAFDRGADVVNVDREPRQLEVASLAARPW